MPDYKQLTKRTRKIPIRKLNQEAAKSKKLLNKIILLSLLIAFIFMLTLYGLSLLKNCSYFKIKKVSVVNHKGRAVSNPQDFFRLDPDSDLNLLNFNMKGLIQDIQAGHPELSQVLIYRQFPNKLLLVVKEREPIAIVLAQDSYLTDEEGFILPYRPADKDLPRIVGINPKQMRIFEKSASLKLKKALGLLKALEKAKVYPQQQISQIDVKQYTDIVFYFKNRVKVKMGGGDFLNKAFLLSKILNRLKKSNTVPKYIDMRFGDPAVRP